MFTPATLRHFTFYGKISVARLSARETTQQVALVAHPTHKLANSSCYYY